MIFCPSVGAAGGPFTPRYHDFAPRPGAGVQLRLPYCAVNMADGTSFECELQQLRLGPPSWRKTCLRVISEFVGACAIRARDVGESPDDVIPLACNGDRSKTRLSVDVRFMFEVVAAPPVYSKEFEVFMLDVPEQVEKINSESGMAFGMPFDSYTTLVLQQQVHHVLRVGPREDQPDSVITYVGTTSAASIGFFPNELADIF